MWSRAPCRSPRRAFNCPMLMWASESEAGGAPLASAAATKSSYSSMAFAESPALCKQSARSQIASSDALLLCGAEKTRSALLAPIRRGEVTTKPEHQDGREMKRKRSLCVIFTITTCRISDRSGIPSNPLSVQDKNSTYLIIII